ncbi:MAG: DUF2589 domain-containing protein [Sphingomonas sp.]
MPLDTSAGNVALNQLTSLPLGFLIGEPLKAAVAAQALAAETTVDFIKSVGFEEVDGKLNAIYLEFIFEDGGGVYRRVRAPMLMLVAVPNIAVTSINVQFKAKIDASASQGSSDSLETNFSTGGSFTRSVTKNRNAGVALKKVNIGGSRTVNSTLNLYASFSSKKDSKATQDSKYSVEYTLDIDVHAEQAGLPQGLATVLNILQDGISKQPLDAQVKIFGLSPVNKVTGSTLTDLSFFVLLLDAGGEPITNAKIELSSVLGMITPVTVTSGTQGVYTIGLTLASGTTVTSNTNETLNLQITTGTSPAEVVTNLTRDITLTV